MSKTRSDLINQALINLQITVAGQEVSAENVQKMDGFVDPAFAQLSALGIYYVQDAGSAGPTGGNIEDEAFLPLSNYLANAASGAFNLANDPRIAVFGTQAEAQLRTIAAPQRTLRTLRVDPAVLPYRRPIYYNGGF